MYLIVLRNVSLSLEEFYPYLTSVDKPMDLAAYETKTNPSMLRIIRHKLCF